MPHSCLYFSIISMINSLFILYIKYQLKSKYLIFMCLTHLIEFFTNFSWISNITFYHRAYKYSTKKPLVVKCTRKQFNNPIIFHLTDTVSPVEDGEQTDNSGSSGGLSPGVYGIIVGVSVVVGLISVICGLYFRRLRHTRNLGTTVTRPRIFVTQSSNYNRI